MLKPKVPKGAGAWKDLDTKTMKRKIKEARKDKSKYKKYLSVWK